MSFVICKQSVRLQNNEALIKYGERGDKLYLIRYGKVRILRPDDSAPGGRVEVAKLGRGNLVGERTVVTGTLYTRIHANWPCSCFNTCILLMPEART